jgi:hypothetical protein
MIVKHKHHIVPRHDGGTDDPSNLIELTVEEHAEAHRLLYEKYGKWQDKIAYEGLLKMIDRQTIISETQSKALRDYHKKPEVKEKYRKLNEERWKDEEHRKNVSEKTKQQWKNPDFVEMHSNLMRDLSKNFWSDPIIREKLTNKNKHNNRKVVSLNDGKITTWSNKVKHERKTGYKHEWKEMEG